MNFYSSSVALLWVTAFRVVAPPSSSRPSRLNSTPSALNNSGFLRQCSRNENYVCACFPDRASDSSCQQG
jgi:hypothetical protein